MTAAFVSASVLRMACKSWGNYSTTGDLSFLTCTTGRAIQMTGIITTEEQMILLVRDLKS